MRHAASHLGCTSQLHISVASLVWTSQFLLLLAPQCCTSNLHALCTSAPSVAPLFNLIFKAKCYQVGSLVPLAWPSQLSLKVWLNRGVAAARSAAVSPRLDVYFVVALLFACSNLDVAPSFCEFKVSYASRMSFSALLASLG